MVIGAVMEDVPVYGTVMVEDGEVVGVRMMTVVGSPLPGAGKIVLVMGPSMAVDSVQGPTTVTQAEQSSWLRSAQTWHCSVAAEAPTTSLICLTFS